MLKRWQPTASILILTGRVYRYWLKCKSDAHSLNISDPKLFTPNIRGYLNAIKFFLVKNFRQSMRQWVPKTVEILGEVLLSYFYIILRETELEKSFTVRPTMKGRLVNKLRAAYEFSRNNCEDLPLPIQMQLSKKKALHKIYRHFEWAINLEYFQRK